MTPFEKDLQTYFPDLYNFWAIAKFDKHHNTVIDAVNDMVKNNKYGIVEIHYNNGKISYVFKKENLTSLTNQS